MFIRSLLLIFSLAPISAQAADPPRPNVLWILAEDLCPDFACYGNPDITTPNIDAFASEGVMYTNAHATASVCSTSRSALITGRHQTSIGVHHHRSHRTDGYQLPNHVKLLPEMLRDAGYFNVKITKFPASLQLTLHGKEDWNFTHPEHLWDSQSWSDLKSNQPFYAQINFGEAHRPYRSAGPKIDPATINSLPPYIADHEVSRRDWADYLETLQLIDEKFGMVMEQLRRDGLLNNTVVIFMGDHGREDFRGKSTAFFAGTHTPLIVRWPDALTPEGIRAGMKSNKLISLLDVHAATCKLAGVELPDDCWGLPTLTDSDFHRKHLVTARDRIENAVDRVRVVQTGRYRYIRIILDQPHLLERRYYDRTNPVRNLMRELNASGKLTAGQAKVFDTPRAPEELYDLKNDPFEFENLSNSDNPEHQSALKEMREHLDRWIVETGDMGDQPEPEEAKNATQGKRRRGGGGNGQAGRRRGRSALIRRVESRWNENETICRRT